MNKILCFFMVGLTFTALNVATVAAQNDLLPTSDPSATPIGEGGDGSGPAAADMSSTMIDDGGLGANSGAAAEAAKAAAIEKCVNDLTDSGMGKKNAEDICKEKAQERMIKGTK